MRMKNGKFLFTLKVFIVIGFISSVFFYTEIKLRSVPNNYVFKKRNFEKQLDSIEILFLGSSEPLDDINPGYIDNYGFNLSSIWQSLYYDKELTIRYLDRMPQLKIVFISVSYFSLWTSIDNSIENWRQYFYYHYWNIPLIKPVMFDLKKESYIALYGTDFSQNALRKNFEVTAITDNIMDNGWQKLEQQMDKNKCDSLGKIFVESHEKAMHDDQLKNNVFNMESLLSALIARNIVPVIITTPVYPSYTKYTDKEKLQAMRNVINGLCGKYHCSYFDYLNDMRFSVEFFYDPAHLNEKGAELFSKVINKEIISKMKK